MKIDIMHYAKSAQIYIEPDQVERYRENIESIIEMVSRLPDNTESHSFLNPENPMVLREDTAEENFEREYVLANAPSVHEGCVVVPRTVE